MQLDVYHTSHTGQIPWAVSQTRTSMCCYVLLPLICLSVFINWLLPEKQKAREGWRRKTSVFFCSYILRSVNQWWVKFNAFDWGIPGVPQGEKKGERKMGEVAEKERWDVRKETNGGKEQRDACSENLEHSWHYSRNHQKLHFSWKYRYIATK